ncbi:hypothetical protein AALO_G00268120 [Alosa alosa]|uniref:Secreted protein n=1 Tax=Alosa alosa TaxID=278164 RepID=A0AAV6FM15_9TELE|nr:hypothetical protein AALO_G00268120 [Alosa alosa]
MTLISGSLGVLFLCVAGSGGVYYICKRRKSTHRTAKAEETEVEYADVSILERQKKQPHQKGRQKEAVEYGELNVQRAKAEELEVEYADVSILKRQKKQLHQKKRREEAVEYGDVERPERSHTGRAGGVYSPDC